MLKTEVSTQPKRSKPLSAAEPNDPSPVTTTELAQREDSFEEGVRLLRIGRTSVMVSDRILLVIGGLLTPLGIALVLFGWWGASRTPLGFEQTPYLISGGLLGLAVVFVGCFLYFGHWQTQMIKEHRQQSATLLAAVERLNDTVAKALTRD